MENKLSELQVWMQKVVTGQNSIKDQGINPQNIVINTARLSAINRLEIYQTSYWLRLIDCLASMYPALEKFTGKEIFRLFAKDYLRSHPPTSYTLSELGENFPAFLRHTKPSETESIWSDLIIELSEFEYLFGKIYDDEGSEDLHLLTSEDLLTLPPEKLLTYPLKFVPNVLFSQFNYPIKSLFNQLRSRKKIHSKNIESSPTFYCIFRHQYRVQIIELDKDQFQVLQGIQKNMTLEQAFSFSGISEKPSLLLTAINFADIGVFLR